MKALVGAFNQEKALVGAFSMIVKTDCETDGALHSTSINDGVLQLNSAAGKQGEKTIHWAAASIIYRWGSPISCDG